MILKSLKKYRYLQLELSSYFFASRESLYTETGWQTLQNRRYAAKMITMFKIDNGNAPPYLNDSIPDKHKNVSSYNTRNKNKYFIPRCRLELF